MLQSFKSINELVEYLGRLEKRLKSLEEQDHTSQTSPALMDNNMNELVEYLGGVEKRLKSLEEENRKLHAAPAPASISNVDERTIAKMVASFLPLTNIVHPSFLKRAFAIWGHFMVAHLIITIPILIVYYCFMSVLIASLFGNTR